MRRVMMDYNHWGAIALLGEILPWEDNRVELAAEKDRNGIPVAKVTFNLHRQRKKDDRVRKEQGHGDYAGGWSGRGRPGSTLRPFDRRCSHGKRLAHFRRGLVRTHARYSESFCL
jgi:hypothetical protein